MHLNPLSKYIYIKPCLFSIKILTRIYLSVLRVPFSPCLIQICQRLLIVYLIINLFSREMLTLLKEADQHSRET